MISTIRSWPSLKVMHLEHTDVIWCLFFEFPIFIHVIFIYKFIIHVPQALSFLFIYSKVNILQFYLS